MPVNMFGSMVAASLTAAAAKETHQEEPAERSGGKPQQKYDESFNEGSEE